MYASSHGHRGRRRAGDCPRFRPLEALEGRLLLAAGLSPRLGGAFEDADFAISYADLWQAISGEEIPAEPPSFVVQSIQSGTLAVGAAPAAPGATLVTPADTLTWHPPADANRTLDAFTLRQWDGQHATGDPIAIRVEVAGVEDAPVGQLADVLLNGTRTTSIDLTGAFRDADAPGAVVAVNTVLGSFFVHLLDARAPQSTAEFLRRVAAGDYATSLIHRLTVGESLQGGGYRTYGGSDDPARALPLAAGQAVDNEFSAANLRGTVALAGGDGDGADQWLVNLADNSAELDQQGVAVFGEVMGDGLAVLDAIAALPTYDAGGDLSALPLRDYAGGAARNANLVIVHSVTVVPPVTFEVIGNSNPSLVTATVSGGVLSVAAARGEAGTATITVRATDRSGSHVDASFVAAATGVSVQAADAAAAETRPGRKSNAAAFVITRTGSTRCPLDVNFALGGSAQAGADYTLAGAGGTSVTIPAGKKSIRLSVVVNNDWDIEGAEQAVLSLLAGCGYIVTGGPAAVAIADDDLPIISISAPDAAAGETRDGEPADTGTFRVSCNVPAPQELTVQLKLSGTAKAGGDFARLPKTVTIAAGETYADITLAPIDDARADAGETVTLSLQAPRRGAGYALADDPADRAATIAVADNEPTVSIVATDAAAGEVGPDGGAFRIERTGEAEDKLMVSLRRGGIARIGSDYVLRVGDEPSAGTRITLAAGQQAVDVLLVPVVDTLAEGDENVTLSLGRSGKYNVAAAPADAAEVVIADNDPPTLTAFAILAGAAINTPFVVSYDSLVAAGDAADPEAQTLSFRLQEVACGTLRKDGQIVRPGDTLAAGEQFIWTPPANTAAVLDAFSLVAFDGVMASVPAVMVSVDVLLVPGG